MKVGDLVMFKKTGKICIVVKVYSTGLISVSNFPPNEVFDPCEWRLLSAGG